MSLYDINSKLDAFMFAIDEINQGVPVDTVKENYPDIADFLIVDENGRLLAEEVGGIVDGFYASFDQKVEDCANFIRNLEGDVELIKAERDRLMKRQKSCENRIAWLKEYLAANLGYKPFSSSVSPLRITFRQTQSVEVDDEESLPAEFLRRSETVAPDKVAIRKELKAGVIIPGARLITKTSMQIK
jgi:hypothetical protein